MSWRHLVDPQLLPILDAYPPVPLDETTLPFLRNRELLAPEFDPSGVTLDRVQHGPVLLHVYLPDTPATDRGCIYHIHGGGYLTGSGASVEFRHRPLARELGCAIVSVDYRLAPEHAHPTPIQDCYAGLAWLFDNAARLGIDPARIGVMGESAGGGLAAALALMARDRGEYPLAFQHLIYPMLDDRTGSGEASGVAGEFIWTAAHNRFAWGCLLGGAEADCYAAPARATDLTSLPPCFISCGALDLFVDENLTYARGLLAAGIPTEAHIYPGAFHGFDYLPISAVGRAAISDSTAALRRALERSAAND